MYKKLAYLNFFILLLSSPLIAGNEYRKLPVECARSLQPALEKLLQLEEIKNLIGQIQKDGPIRIIENSNQVSKEFGAFWDIDQRNICINLSAHPSLGKVIGSILFELHNAAANSKLNYLDRLAAARVLDKDNYVKAIEHVEFENSILASKLSKKGIEAGIFPRDAYLPTYHNFDEHFYWQQKSGHSYWIGKNYEQVLAFPFRG